MTSDISAREEKEIHRKLSTENPMIKLVYMTPEKLLQSEKTKDLIKTLYDEKMISRFVIDEGHCVTQWGHDFRPDYSRLCCLRQEYPKVPIMVLTATATNLVKKDILSQLGISARVKT